MKALSVLVQRDEPADCAIDTIGRHRRYTAGLLGGQVANLG